MPAPESGSPDPAVAALPERALDGLRILVTGASGFIGGHTVARLHQLGAEVHAVHRSPAPRPSATPVVWHRADLTDARAAMAAVAAARPHQIVHLASLVKGSRDPALLLATMEANVVGTVNVLDAARRAEVRRVQLAGSLETPEPGQVATSPYALSKAAAGLYGAYYRTVERLEVIELQIFMTYGPDTPDRSKLVPYVIERLLAGEVPELSSGARPVDWVHVHDVAEGIARCALVDPAPDEPVPLGTGALHPIRQVVEHLVELTGAEVEPRFGSIGDRSNEVVRAADVDRTRSQLGGWSPSTALRDGLATTVAWHRRRSAGDDSATVPSVEPQATPGPVR